MNHALREIALSSKLWPAQEAARLVKLFEKNPPAKGYVLFETGYGPSGIPHIGTFGEVARTTMIYNAFKVMCDIPARLICFSDDYDGLRSVPENILHREEVAKHLQKPLTSVPDPFGTHSSYGEHNNALLRGFLDRFNFEYTFYSATEFYRSGQFDEVLLRTLHHYDEIMGIMLKSLGEERRQTYSIFLPIHPRTGKIIYVPMKSIDPGAGTVTFDDEDGDEYTVPVTGGHVKLQWKPDFGARWAALQVDFEMYGKDHYANTAIYDGICKVLGQKPPQHYIYELFLDENGEKISKSKGNGISIDQWLKYATAESLSYYMFQKPKTAKRLHFDVIPKAVEEYHQQLRAYETQDDAARFNNPVWHIHKGNVPKSTMDISFTMLLNLALTVGAENADQLMAYIKQYVPDTTPEKSPDLYTAVQFAVQYYKDYVKDSKVYRLATPSEREALLELRSLLAGYEGEVEGEALQSLVFAVGRERFDPLRDWFKALYQVLLAQDQGPRFGSFIALFGVQNTIELIDKALAGALVKKEGDSI